MSVLTRTPKVVGAEALVPAEGRPVPYANFDYAASTPCLETVFEAVTQALPYYSSVHRGAGYASQVTTQAYEQARESVRKFLGGPQAVVFTRNTTDSFNLLARALPAGTSVVVFESEHHATQLPWQNAVRLPIPADPVQALTAAAEALRSCPQGPRLLVVTAASNVTGELWPLQELADLAHRCGARIAVDAAQLAPHRPLDVQDLDYVALSGHKLYAPFGTGVLAGRADWLRAADPYLRGGGATKHVGDHGTVVWAADAEQRHEAGTPNVLGAIALATACEALTDWDALIAEEGRLLARLRRGLAELPSVKELSLWGPKHPRVGIVSFTVEGHSARSVAEYLSAEHGIGVRDGKFCAHPLVRHLTDGENCGGTAVRASIGLGTTDEHVDRLVTALRTLTER